jgi:hypothetical protein
MKMGNLMREVRSAVYRSEKPEDRLHLGLSEIAQDGGGACPREDARRSCWLEGGGVKRDGLRFRRAQGLLGVASSSATYEARARQEIHFELIAGKTQGEGAVRVEPWRRAARIGASRSLSILVRGW